MPSEIKATARLEALGELAEALSGAITRREVADVIVARGPRIVGADLCTLHVPGARAGTLELLASAGVDSAIVHQISEITPASNNPALDTLKTGAALWVESEAQYRALYPDLVDTARTQPRARAFWSVPLISEGVPIGLLGMGFHDERAFPPDERAFVLTFARLCGEALRRTERVEAMRRTSERAHALRASYETTLRSIGDAVITTDAEGRITLMNPIAERLTGWREADAIGQPSSAVFRIEHETPEHVADPVAQALREDRVVALANHTLLLHRDGFTRTPIEDSAAPIRGEEVASGGVVLVFRDVSAKKARDARVGFLERATAALAESLDYESTVAKVARLAVPVLADWCSVEVVDESGGHARQIAVAHVDPEKMELARTYAARYPPDPDATSGAPNVLRTGRSELYPVLTDELIALGAKDEEHLALLRSLQLRSLLFAPLSVRGRVLGVITFVQAESGRHYCQEDLLFAEDLARRCAFAIDNARLYAAELSARRAAVVANRAKDEFLAMMSHELRTPLSSIMGWSKLAMGPTAEPALIARGLDVIHRNTVAMNAIIEDLLDLSRIVSGKIRLDLRQLDLARTIEIAIDAIRADADAKRIVIESTLAREAGAIRGDATRLAQILGNLLSNAVKFTPEGGKITVVLRGDGAHVEVEVRDTGKGIDAAFLPHVFELFQQEEGTVRARGGLGLGLSISKRLAESHGGTITAFSEGPGRGARFVVHLPAHAGEPDTKPRPELGTRASGTLPIVGSLEGIRVLTVDDDDDARAFVKAALELRGASVRSASNVDDALLAIDAEIPDVLLSDIGMPVRDGYSLIEELRRRPPERGGALPAAAVSAYAYEHDRERALRSGFAAHLAKPVDPTDLVALVLRLARG